MNNYVELIEKRLCELKQENPLLVNFFDEFADHDLIIIGGFIRNCINNEKSRDIDLVLNSDDIDAIENVIEKLKLKYDKNRFNGYKIHFDNVDVDIWNINYHVPFLYSAYRPSFENLAESTFTNYDSLLYDINSKKLNIEHYLECVSSKQIDFVGNSDAIKANPFKYLSMANIFETCFEKGYTMSDRVDDYVNYHCEINEDRFVRLLREEYQKHYGYDMSYELVCYILDFATENYYKVRQKNKGI